MHEGPGVPELTGHEVRGRLHHLRVICELEEEQRGEGGEPESWHLEVSEEGAQE